MYPSKENKHFHYRPAYKAECIKAALNLHKELGMNTKQASEIIMVDYDNLNNWLLAYHYYLATGEVMLNRGFKKVIPHLVVQGLDIFKSKKQKDDVQ